MVRNPPAIAGDTRDADLIPGSGRSLGEGNGNPLQYLPVFMHEESPGQRDWWAVVYGVTKSWTQLSD